MSFGPFSFRTRLLEKDGVPVKLGGRATDILRLLVSRAGEVIPKDEILAYAWSGLVVEEISLRVHIAELRKALGDGKDGARYITNVPSRGYCFVAPVCSEACRRRRHHHRSSPERAAPVSLPHRLERMVGREDVLQELSARLLSDRFITLRGPGGIGKTTVAVALAHDMLAAFDGHVHFLDLAPLRDATLVASTRRCGVGPCRASRRSHGQHHQLSCAIAACFSSSTAANTLSTSSPGLQRTFTSGHPASASWQPAESRLLVQGEQIFELVPLQGPPQGSGLSVSQALSYPAVRLFVERATAAGHRADMTDDDAAVLAEICGKLDGIALAIELAAVRVGVHGLREVAALLDGRLKLEWRGRRTAPPRHQTLGATLDWSYGLIDESERVALRRFSVFAGSFTLQGAMAVAGDDSEPADQIVDALGQLVAKSLVSARPEGASTRYRLLDTTKAYAMQKLVGCRRSGEDRPSACQLRPAGA